MCVCLLLQDIVCVFITGLGRRIHGSVEDTKLSTNKQHSLSGVAECASASLPPASSSLTHARRMDGFCNQNADQLGYLAGLSCNTYTIRDHA